MDSFGPRRGRAEPRLTGPPPDLARRWIVVGGVLVAAVVFFAVLNAFWGPGSTADVPPVATDSALARGGMSEPAEVAPMLPEAESSGADDANGSDSAGSGVGGRGVRESGSKSDSSKSDSGKSDSGKSDSGKSDSGKSDSSKSGSSKSDSGRSASAKARAGGGGARAEKSTGDGSGSSEPPDGRASDRSSDGEANSTSRSNNPYADGAVRSDRRYRTNLPGGSRDTSGSVGEDGAGGSTVAGGPSRTPSPSGSSGPISAIRPSARASGVLPPHFDPPIPRRGPVADRVPQQSGSSTVADRVPQQSGSSATNGPADLDPAPVGDGSINSESQHNRIVINGSEREMSPEEVRAMVRSILDSIGIHMDIDGSGSGGPIEISGHGWTVTNRGTK